MIKYTEDRIVAVSLPILCVAERLLIRHSRVSFSIWAGKRFNLPASLPASSRSSHRVWIPWTRPLLRVRFWRCVISIIWPKSFLVLKLGYQFTVSSVTVNFTAGSMPCKARLRIVPKPSLPAWQVCLMM